MSNKYLQGYLPKIQYWTQQLVQATADGDAIKMQRAKSRLDYFYDKQISKL